MQETTTVKHETTTVHTVKLTYGEVEAALRKALNLPNGRFEWEMDEDTIYGVSIITTVYEVKEE